jgi:hypothetical protein
MATQDRDDRLVAQRYVGVGGPVRERRLRGDDVYLPPRRTE